MFYKEINISNLEKYIGINFFQYAHLFLLSKHF